MTELMYLHIEILVSLQESLIEKSWEGKKQYSNTLVPTSVVRILSTNAKVVIKLREPATSGMFLVYTNCEEED